MYRHCSRDRQTLCSQICSGVAPKPGQACLFPPCVTRVPWHRASVVCFWCVHLQYTRIYAEQHAPSVHTYTHVCTHTRTRMHTLSCGNRETIDRSCVVIGFAHAAATIEHSERRGSQHIGGPVLRACGSCHGPAQALCFALRGSATGTQQKRRQRWRRRRQLSRRWTSRRYHLCRPTRWAYSFE